MTAAPTPRHGEHPQPTSTRPHDEQTNTVDELDDLIEIHGRVERFATALRERGLSVIVEIDGYDIHIRVEEP